MSQQGTFKSFNPAKGYGFVVCNGQDIFFLRKDVVGKPPQEGDTLFFDLQPNPKDASKMMAINISGGTQGGNLQGTVNKYIDWKGYGFIDYQGQTHFVHKDEIKDGNALVEGDQVWFDIVPSPKNPAQTVCANVVGGSGGAKGGGGKGGGKDMMAMMGAMMAMMGGKGKGMGKGMMGKGKGPY
eukprot:TRINITY_DN784_c0_g1_i2.p1 TRINITY_DN784_c0_g1~~TRINITY_DN784_c0_g1_i2.p1  ORF type:complete len:200 (+),score=56.42 TRINITY_DN784_c0_g1_i2:53-601(+)